MLKHIHVNYYKEIWTINPLDCSKQEANKSPIFRLHYWSLGSSWELGMNKMERPSYFCLSRINWEGCHWSTLPCQEASQEAATCQSICRLQSFICTSIPTSSLAQCTFDSINHSHSTTLVVMPNEHIICRPVKSHFAHSGFKVLCYMGPHCSNVQHIIYIAHMETELKSHLFQHWFRTLDSVHVPTGPTHTPRDIQG